MELIAALALGILGILGAVLSRLLADDFKAWTPRIVESLIRRAIRRLPESMRERFTEEWRSDVNDTPGDIGKLVKALGFRRAARRMAPGFFADNEETWFGDLIKRVVDVALVSPLLIFLSPILVFTAVLIRIESRGPILYRQERVGLHGRLFTIFKFRTMAVEAEARESPRWIDEHDPRITRLGWILRSIRVDELPLLLNVLSGDMSLVGPRPERPFFVESLSQAIPKYGDRHLVRPGITGLAQIRS